MTEPDSHDLRRKLQRWTVSPPDDAARDRMIAMALQKPQKTPWQQAMAREIERSLTDWRYGLAYKAAAAAACLLLGLGAGLAAAPPVSVANVALITNLGTPS